MGPKISKTTKWAAYSVITYFFIALLTTFSALLAFVASAKPYPPQTQFFSYFGFLLLYGVFYAALMVLKGEDTGRKYLIGMFVFLGVNMLFVVLAGADVLSFMLLGFYVYIIVYFTRPNTKIQFHPKNTMTEDGALNETTTDVAPAKNSKKVTWVLLLILMLNLLFLPYVFSGPEHYSMYVKPFDTILRITTVPLTILVFTLLFFMYKRKEWARHVYVICTTACLVITLIMPFIIMEEELKRYFDREWGEQEVSWEVDTAKLEGLTPEQIEHFHEMMNSFEEQGHMMAYHGINFFVIGLYSFLIYFFTRRNVKLEFG